MRILKNPSDAEEAAQETFARLCSQVREGQELHHARKWAATVAMNLCFDRRRERARETPVDLELECGTAEGRLDSLGLEVLRQRIEDLPERYQLVLHYGFAMGLKPREIAQVMGIEDGAARVLLHRALAALRRKVKE